MHFGRIGYAGAGPRQFQAFSAARQEFLTTLGDWLSAQPEAEEAREEIRATLSATRQIAALNGVAV